MSYLYIGLVIIACGLAAYYLRLKCLYVLFIDAFIQNTALPFLYTSFGASRGLVASLLVSKEILLFIIFLWCINVWKNEARRPWPRPVFVLFLFTCYCTIRVGIALASGDDAYQCFSKLRMVCLPLQFLTVALTVGYTQPEFAKKFLRQMTYLLAALALLGILMWLLPPSDFWVSHANMAAYGLEVKGADPIGYVESEGVTGTSAGRESFLSLAAFRAFGTFGDPLSMGFALSSSFLVLAFVFRKQWFSWILILLVTIGMFATFDRSVWIFVFVASIFLLYRGRRYKWLLSFSLAPILALLTIPSLADFAKSEYEYLSWSQPVGAHAEGIVWLYQRSFTAPENLLGKGMRDDVEVITESGYAWLLEHFGMVAYILWMWFLVSIYRHLKTRDSDVARIPVVSQGMILGVFVIMHFSQYPFSFIGWIPIWYIFGLAVADVPVETSIGEEGLSDGEAQKALPESGNFEGEDFGGTPQLS